MGVNSAPIVAIRALAVKRPSQREGRLRLALSLIRMATRKTIMTQRLKIELELTGDEEGDIEQALDEAVRLIREGYTSGMDKNETGSFNFTVTDVGAEEDRQARRERAAP